MHDTLVKYYCLQTNIALLHFCHLHSSITNTPTYAVGKCCYYAEITAHLHMLTANLRLLYGLIIVHIPILVYLHILNIYRITYLVYMYNNMTIYFAHIKVIVFQIWFCAYTRTDRKVDIIRHR